MGENTPEEVKGGGGPSSRGAAFGLNLSSALGLEEITDGTSEFVIAISRHHVARTRNVNVLRMRNLVEKFPRSFFADQIAHSPPHKKCGDGEAPGCPFQALPMLE